MFRTLIMTTGMLPFLAASVASQKQDASAEAKRTDTVLDPAGIPSLMGMPGNGQEPTGSEEMPPVYMGNGVFLQMPKGGEEGDLVVDCLSVRGSETAMGHTILFDGGLREFVSLASVQRMGGSHFVFPARA